MSLFLILDIETSKDSEGNDVPVEVAAVVYDTETSTILGTFSTLIYADVPAAADVHRIPVNAIWKGVDFDGEGKEGKIHIKEILRLTKQWCASDFSYLVAHNAEFEQRFIEGGSIPWLCTYKDFDLFPTNYNGKRDLISLAQWYGVGVSVTHRAIYDCLLLAEVFNRVPDLNKEIDYALRPKVEWMSPLFDESGKKIDHAPPSFAWDYSLQGWIGKSGKHATGSVFFPLGSDRRTVAAKVQYADRALPKAWGFQWDGDRKIWTRQASQNALDLFPFPVEVI